MPLGDSLTSGCCNSVEGGFRPRLYGALLEAGYTVDLVGTQSILSNNSSLPDPDHEGLGGFEIGALDAVVEDALNAVDDPDVILLLIGTNDFAGNNDVVNARNRLENLIVHVATLRPHAKIIVANLLLRYDLPEADQQIQQLYNPYIPGIVDHQVSLGRQVSFVDMRSSCTPSDFVDGLHPTVTGYNKMGEKWVESIVQVIQPTGTTNRPVLVSAAGQADLRHVVLTFSKPVSDASANSANFSLSGGLSVSAATLDPVTKRVITLTTSLQNRDRSFTVTVNGVRDRTPQQNIIAANSTASFRSKDVAEAGNYTLVYSLRIPNQADFNWRGVPYAVDNHASVGSFSRVAYYLELQSPGGSLEYVWVSMNAFTTDAGKIGVPTVQSGAFFQQSVSGMNVRSSVLPSATGVAGRLEFWPGDYGPGNEDNVAGASDSDYDQGDTGTPGVAGYGSMQVHQTGAGRTIFAFNGWGGAGLINDLGMGNASSGDRDWTFAQNADGYRVKSLQVYVLPSGTPNTPVIETQPSNLSAVVGSTALFNIEASGPGSLSYQWRFNGQAIPGATGTSYTVNNVQQGHAGSYDVVVGNLFGSTTSAAAVLTVVPLGAVANGSFESGYSAWMASGNQSVVTSGGFYQASAGTQLIVFNGGNTAPNGFLSQSFATTPGQAYTLRVDLGVLAFNGNEQRLQVGLEGSRTLLGRTLSVFGDGNGVPRWFPESLTFVADSRTTTLTLQDVSASTSGLDMLLDNIRVEVEGQLWRTLYVRSVNPSSWLTVTVSPPDVQGTSNGTTAFSRTYPHGTVVTLTAPATWSGNKFLKWEQNGVDLSFSPSVNVTVNGDHNLTAVYESLIRGAYVFYNESAWDGNDPGATATDDQAIAIDKVPLRRGGKATAANYTSFFRGLNGLMVDISAIPGNPTTADFVFKQGNDNSPQGWAAAPAPSTIVVRPDAGVGGSDRLTLLWPQSAIEQKWLEVTILPTPNTGLAHPEIFYFGNAVGEALNSTSDAKVDPADEILTRNNSRTLLNPAPIDFPYDFNRDKRVDPADQLIARGHQTTVVTALKLIDLTGVGPSSYVLDGAGLPGQTVYQLASRASTSVSSVTWRVLSRGGGEALVLEVRRAPHGIVRVETTEDLHTQAWSVLDVPEAETGDDVNLRWVLPIEAGAPQRFYRAVLRPSHPSDLPHH